MNRLRPLMLALALPLLPLGLTLPPSAAHAAEPSRRGNKVELDVRVVYATTDHDRVDPKLEKLRSKMNHFKYTGFEQLDARTLTVSGKGTESFGIVGGRKVEVELLSRSDDKARMRLRMLGKSGRTIVDITFAVRRNGEAIVAGPRHKNGILVLPVKASY